MNMTRSTRPKPEDGWILVSRRASKAVEIAVAVAGLVGLGFTAWAFYSSPDNPFRQREYGFEAIRPLHAGNTQAFFEEQLGVPNSIRPLSEADDVNELLFVEKEYAVTAVVDRTGRVILYSVLACNPGFAPRFVTPAGTSVRLNAEPLTRAETEGAGHDPVDGRRLGYTPAFTRTSPDQLIEIGQYSNTPDTGFRSYLLGVNGACASTNYSDNIDTSLILTSEEYAQVYADDVAAYRDTHRPNFYAETVEAAVTFSDGNCLTLTNSYASLDSDGLCVLASADTLGLPRDFLQQAG